MWKLLKNGGESRKKQEINSMLKQKQKKKDKNKNTHKYGKLEVCEQIEGIPISCIIIYSQIFIQCVPSTSHCAS